MSQKHRHICAVIPARYASTRLPGKPLIEFMGKPMIQWVYEAAGEVYKNVAVATDDDRIVSCVESFGGKAVLTSDQHPNGTSRVLEAYELLDWSSVYVVNIQGDEPMIDIQSLQDLNAILTKGHADIATLVSKVTDMEELRNKSEVFVVHDVHNRALYFSRAVIPVWKDLSKSEWLDHGIFYKHIGLYAYRPEILKKLVRLSPVDLELAEGLEQNRWLAHGYAIHTGLTATVSYPVDTPQDVNLVRKMMEKSKV